MAHVISPTVTLQFLNDYVSYAPTVESYAPPDISASAHVYIGAIATYVGELRAAGNRLDQLPPGALGAISTAQMSAAYTALSAYSTNICHYTIGGTAGA